MRSIDPTNLTSRWRAADLLGADAIRSSPLPESCRLGSAGSGKHVFMLVTDLGTGNERGNVRYYHRFPRSRRRSLLLSCSLVCACDARFVLIGSVIGLVGTTSTDMGVRSFAVKARNLC